MRVRSGRRTLARVRYQGWRTSQGPQRVPGRFFEPLFALPCRLPRLHVVERQPTQENTCPQRSAVTVWMILLTREEEKNDCPLTRASTWRSKSDNWSHKRACPDGSPRQKPQFALIL